MVRSNTAIKYVIFLALVVCLVLVPYVLASGTKFIVEPGGPNITFNKTESSDPVNASTFLTYYLNISVYNMTHQFTNISEMNVTETYPSDVIFVSSQPVVPMATNNTFVIVNITTNTTIQINITVMVRNITNGSVINNSARLSFFIPNSVQYAGVQLNISNLTAENTTVNNPPFYNFTNLSVTKTDSPDPVTVSTNLTYQINITNTGNGTAYNVFVNETYPPQVIYLNSTPAPSGGTNYTFYVPFNMGPGQKFSINITVLVLNITNGTVINNTINYSFANETNNALTRLVTENTTVLNSPAYNTSTITVTKTGTPNPVGINTQLYYVITVSASGNGTSFNVTVNDTYPAGLVFNSSWPSPIAGTNNNWNFSSITSGTSILINITMNVTSLADGTVLTNSVNVTYQNERSGNLTVTASSSTTVSNPAVQPGGVSGGGGGGGGGYHYVNRTNTTTTSCFESWTCEAWSDCVNNQQSRECADLRACGTTLLKPKITQSCTITAPNAPEPQPVAEPAPAPENNQGILSVQGKSPMPTLEKVFYGLAILALVGLLVYLGIMHKRSKQK